MHPAPLITTDPMPNNPVYHNVSRKGTADEYDAMAIDHAPGKNSKCEPTGVLNLVRWR
jgi:hypothetical protein